MKWLSPSEFNWGDAPLNKFWHAGVTVSAYLALVFTIEHVIQKTGGLGRKATKWVKIWQAGHNLFLSVGSLAMVVSACYLAVAYKLGLYPDDPDTGTEFLICTLSDRPASGRLFYWVYIFYLSKYVELLDTVIQMLKGRRPPSFYFHTWHHTAYLLICWGYNEYRSSLSYLAIIINGSVHVIMYYYYYTISRISIDKEEEEPDKTQLLKERGGETEPSNRFDAKTASSPALKKAPPRISKGSSVWWKHYITQIQIIQFIAGYGFFSLYVKRRYFDHYDCNGEGVLLLHALFNLTMLTGFIKILTRIRRKSRGKRVIDNSPPTPATVVGS